MKSVSGVSDCNMNQASGLNPFPNNKILTLPKLEDFADKHFRSNEYCGKFSKKCRKFYMGLYTEILGVFCFKPIPRYCNVWYEGILRISHTGPSFASLFTDAMIC